MESWEEIKGNLLHSFVVNAGRCALENEAGIEISYTAMEAGIERAIKAMEDGEWNA